MPRVSVVIPTYNRAHVVTRAIDSVLAQTYTDVEVIVVDDGSTDNTREVLQRYGERITYICQENGGTGKARNTGWRAASGEFLNFLDSDDLLLPRKLEAQVAYLDAHPDADVVICGWHDISEEDGSLVGEWTSIGVHEMLKTNLLAGNQGLLPPHALLLRRGCVERAGGFDETLPIRETEDFWLRLELAGSKFGMIEEVLCIYMDQSDGRGKSQTKLERVMPIILDRVFSHPDLPPAIAAMKDEIYARSAIDFGLHHYTKYDVPAVERLLKARGYMTGAMRGRDITRWRSDTFDPIVYTAIELDHAHPEASLRRMFDELFPDVDQLPWLRSHLLGTLHAIRAFQEYEEGHRGQAIYHVARGVSHDWRLLKNRGIPNILLRSLLPRRAPANRPQA